MSMKIIATRTVGAAVTLAAVFFAGSTALGAEPVRLKFAFIANETEITYVSAIKPFIDAVNRDGKDVVQIDFFPNGALSRNFPQQSQIVLDGIADIAFVVPGLTPGRFPDNGALELPGLFQNLRESTLTYTRVLAQSHLRGYEDYFVIAALGTPPYTIFSKKPIKNLADLNGIRCAVTSSTAAASMRALDGVPVPMPVSEMAEGIGRGTVDAGLIWLAPMIDYGAIRVTSYDYGLKFGINPVAVLMNRAKFDELPPKAQDIIKKYSGEWIAQQYAEAATARLNKLQDDLLENSKRIAVAPTPADQAAATEKFETIYRDWLAKDPKNSGLLQSIKEELATLR
jgi:TRAP-type C4-dicarboxylate transport system substrate-binding protein